MEKDITLLDIKQYDTEFYYMLDNIGLEGITEQLRNKKNLMTDLTGFARSSGEQIDQVMHATMEQGNKVSLSVTVDLDNSELTIYEINKIPEDARSNKNTKFKKCSISEYLKSIGKEDEMVRPSLIETLHQKQEQLRYSQAQGNECRHKGYETIK